MKRRTAPRTVTAAAAVLALAAAALIGPALTERGTPQAHALTPPVAMTADDLPTWQTNGVVWAMAQSDGVVFAGGTFSAVRPPGAEAGTDERQAVNFAAFDAATGAPTDCRLDFTVGSGTATVRALAVSPDGETLYAGGNFAAVNGTYVSRVAAIDIPSCTVKPEFNVSVSATVHALAATDDTVYLGGAFTSVDGQSRGKFAALSTDGELRSWKADADATGRAVEVTPDGRSVVCSAATSPACGTPTRTRWPSWTRTPARSSTATGAPSCRATRWSRGCTRTRPGSTPPTRAPAAVCFDGRIALNLDDFSQRWRDTCLGATQDVTVYKKVLYSSSHAHDCSSMGEFGELHERQHLLAESVDDPTPLLSWFPDTDDGPLNVEQVGPRAMVVSSRGGKDYMWGGGAFSRIASNGNTPQQGLVRFANGPDTGAPTVPEDVNAANVLGGVRVSWPASTDLDDRTLTYRVYRNGGSEPVGTVRANSAFWDRPTVSFTDTTTDSGTDYTYRGSPRATTGTPTHQLPLRGRESADPGHALGDDRGAGGECRRLCERLLGQLRLRHPYAARRPRLRPLRELRALRGAVRARRNGAGQGPAHRHHQRRQLRCQHGHGHGPPRHRQLERDRGDLGRAALGRLDGTGLAGRRAGAEHGLRHSARHRRRQRRGGREPRPGAHRYGQRQPVAGGPRESGGTGPKLTLTFRKP